MVESLRGNINTRTAIMIFVPIIVTFWLATTPPAFIADAIETLELGYYNFCLALKQGDDDLRDIIIVAIDDETRAEIRDPWPWKREYHARVVDRLARAGAKVIGIDLFLASLSKYGARDDRAFLSSLKRAGNVILNLGYTFARESGSDQRLKILDRGIAIQSLPETYRRAAAGFGFSGFIKDIDNYHRRIYALEEYDGVSYHPFSLQMAKTFLGLEGCEPVLSRGRLVLGTIDSPVNDDGSISVNFSRGANAIKSIPYSQVFKGTDAHLANGEPMSIFKGKAVLIGWKSFQEVRDLHFCPVGELGTAHEKQEIFGVEMQGYAVSTFIHQKFIRQALLRVETAYILAFCLLLSCLVVRFNPLKAFAPGLVLVVAFAAISIYLFIGQRVYVRIIPLFAAAGISYACITLYEIGRTRKIFSQFVPKVMAERILNTRISLRKVEATIMFADLRGYTAMSEKYDPMDVAALVNGYHAILDRVAMKHGGMTVGNRGDGKIMLFGEDENDTTHAQRAIRAAMEMNNELEAYADGYDKKGWGRISVGLGISTGVVALGFIGGKDYQEFGPQGDAANTAARLQGLSKELGFNVIIGPTTYEKAKYDIVMQPLKKVKVKGKADEIEVYRYVEDTTRS